ncbi:MAG: dTDP-4-dehydrorhamnose reductase [Actinobacteria bacterium RBG_13_35_12]|nr:MAG: dTDP-4-dehydrorhamnose reductase [Actinobacteria bacterium RBG_13_35_12]
MKIALIGVDGQLGTDINSYFKGKGIELKGLVGLKDIDVCDYKMSDGILRSINPDLVINTAAFHDVDLCEDEVLSAFKVNVMGVKNLAMICKEIDVPLMHFSTDYIFDGKKKKPYIEDDCARPLSLYGISKLAGEQVMQYILDKYYIIRLSGLYGHTGCAGKGNINFVEQMIKLSENKKEIKVVNDQVLTPTSTMDVTEKLFELIQTGKYGIYHMTNTGSCSWYEFACEIFRLMKLTARVLPTTTDRFGAKARRPGYSVLDNLNLRKIGLADLRNWKEALKDYIEGRDK